MDETQKAVAEIIASDVRRRIELDLMSDVELNKLFGAEICGYEPGWSGTGISKVSDGVRWIENGRYRFIYHHQIPDYCTDANAVLPWLVKHHWRGHSNGASGGETPYPHFSIKVTEIPTEDRPDRFGNEHLGHCFEGISLVRSFARAAVIALLRAKRATQIS